MKLSETGADGSPQTSAEREALILHAVGQGRIVSLSELQAVTGASLPTLRRDLARLSAQRLLERTRGGARAIEQQSSLEEAFESRRLRNARAKTLIGQAAAALVSADSLVFLNDGSTMLSFAHELAAREIRATVATTALNVAEYLATIPQLDVISVGGFLRQSSFGTVGPLAIRGLEVLTASTAFIGCAGLDRSAGVTWHSMEDAHIAHVMGSRAETVVLLADSSKIGERARATGLTWDDVDILVTDTVPPGFRDELGRHDVQIICP